MEAKLLIVGGKANKHDVKLKLPTVIGRSREADLTVAHPMISRRHCELFESDGLIKVKDLGSLNGTYVHGKRIEGEIVLRPNEEFSIGPLTFRIEYETLAIQPEVPPFVDHETPEYIPSFVEKPAEPVAAPEEPKPAEAPAPEGVSSEAPFAEKVETEQTPPWEELTSLEDELDFDLAEDIATEKESEPQELSPETEEVEEEVSWDEGVQEESIPSELSEAEALPESETPLASETPIDSETLPGYETPLESETPRESESPQETEAPPQLAVQEEKEPPSLEQVSPGPTSASEPTEKEPTEKEPTEKEPTEAEPTEEDKPLAEDMDEIEDAALRDFLEGLH